MRSDGDRLRAEGEVASIHRESEKRDSRDCSPAMRLRQRVLGADEISLVRIGAIVPRVRRHFAIHAVFHGVGCELPCLRCPFHGSHYGAAGCIRKGPEPENLAIPRFVHLRSHRPHRPVLFDGRQTEFPCNAGADLAERVRKAFDDRALRPVIANGRPLWKPGFRSPI